MSPKTKAEKPGETISRAAVAKAAGVSEATVSMALRGLACIRAETRAKVEAAAARLGYRGNAAAAALARQRTRRTAAGGRTELRVAYLHDGGKPGPIDHMARAAEATGLVAEKFAAADFGSPEEATRVLWARGFEGLVLSLRENPWPGSELRRFKWERFSLVKLSRSLPELPCDLVRHSPFDFMATALEEVVARGYRRLAVLPMRTGVTRDDDARLGALLAFVERKRAAGVALEWRELPVAAMRAGRYRFDRETAEWLAGWGPDAIVAHHWTAVYALMEARPRLAKETGLAAVLATRTAHVNTPLVAGCDSNLGELYLRAARLLRDAMGRGQRGVPTHATEHVVEPVWVEGSTLPRRHAARIFEIEKHGAMR